MLKNGAMRFSSAGVRLPQFAQKPGSYELNFGKLLLSTDFSTNASKSGDFHRCTK
jgi:hypothetical protein